MATARVHVLKAGSPTSSQIHSFIQLSILLPASQDNRVVDAPNEELTTCYHIQHPTWIHPVLAANPSLSNSSLASGRTSARNSVANGTLAVPPTPIPTNETPSSNMLYPKEDRDAMALVYKCRTCNYSEPATSYCVYRNQLSSSAGETAGVTTDVGSDPTLPRSSRVCPNCSEMECVFFQSQLRKEETKMVGPQRASSFFVYQSLTVFKIETILCMLLLWTHL